MQQKRLEIWSPLAVTVHVEFLWRCSSDDACPYFTSLSLILWFVKTIAYEQYTDEHRLTGKKTSNLFSGNTDNVSVLFNPCGPIRQVLSAFFMATSISIFQLSWKRLSVKGHQTRVLEYCNLNSRGRLVITSLCEHNNCLITPLQHIYQSRSQKLSLFFIIVSFVCMCVWR